MCSSRGMALAHFKPSIKIQLNVAPGLALRPLEQQPPGSAACRRPDRWAARLAPAYSELPVLAIDLPADFDRAAFTRQCAVFGRIRRQLVQRHAGRRSPLALNCTGGPETRTLLPSSRKYGANFLRGALLRKHA